MILSILICSLHKRSGMMRGLVDELYRQINGNKNVEILTFIDGGEISTGNKRNALVNMAQGLYVVHVDDDDEVASDYVSSILEAAKQDKDAIVFNGIITTDGGNAKKWYISKDLPYKSEIRQWREVFLRYPNHIVPVKRSIAIQVPFENCYRGEDYAYATQLHKRGLIKTETLIDKELYIYKFVNHK
jgi:GT2 family glycosyltransferase